MSSSTLIHATEILPRSTLIDGTVHLGHSFFNLWKSCFCRRTTKIHKFFSCSKVIKRVGRCIWRNHVITTRSMNTGKTSERDVIYSEQCPQVTRRRQLLWPSRITTKVCGQLCCYIDSKNKVRTLATQTVRGHICQNTTIYQPLHPHEELVCQKSDD